MAAIVLDGDASGAVRAAGLAERAMRRVSGAVDDLDKKHKASAFSGRNLAERLTDIDKAAQIVGGPLSSLTPMLNDFGDAIEQVGLRTAVTNVAAAGLASGGLAVMIAGVTAAAAGLIGLGVNAVAVSSDLASFDAILGANSSTMQRNRADLLALSAAQDDLALSTAAARVELAGLAAPVMTELSYAAAGAAGSVQALAEDETGAVSATIGLGEATVALVPGLNVLAAQVWAGSYAVDALAESGREGSAALAAERDAVDQTRTAVESWNLQLQSAINAQDAAAESTIRLAWAHATQLYPALVRENAALQSEAEQIEAWYAPSFDMMADAVSTYHASMLGSTKATKAGGTAAREASVDYGFLADSAREAAAAVAAAESARQDADATAIAEAAIPKDLLGAMGATDGFGAVAFGAMDAAFKQGEEDSAAFIAKAYQLPGEKSDEMREKVTKNFAAIGGAALDLSSTVADAMAQAFEQGGDRSEKARKKQFAAMKAVALLQAGINTALAISNVWASWASVPPVAAALTAIAAGVGAAQIGMIAAKSYHRGGLLPDEVPVIARKNERQAVITAQGMGAIGGEEGLKRINAGSAPAAAPSITLVADGIAARFRRFAEADPSFGQRTRYA